MKETPLLRFFINILFVMKITWVILLVLILERIFEDKEIIIGHYDLKLIYKYIDYIISILIGFLLIILYNHSTPSSICIDGHTKQFLYFYGIITILGNVYEFYRDVHDEI